MLSWVTLAVIYFLLFYFEWKKIRHCIISHYQSSQHSTYPKKLESVALLYFVTYCFAADKYIYNLLNSLMVDTKLTLKYNAILGVGGSLWKKSWLWFKSTGFSDSWEIHYCKQPVLKIALDFIDIYSVFWFVDLISRMDLVGFSL